MRLFQVHCQGHLLLSCAGNSDSIRRKGICGTVRADLQRSMHCDNTYTYTYIYSDSYSHCEYYAHAVCSLLHFVYIVERLSCRTYTNLPHCVNFHLAICFLFPSSSEPSFSCIQLSCCLPFLLPVLSICLCIQRIYIYANFV